MRVIEPESKQGAFLLFVVTLIFVCFEWYVVAGLVFVLLLFWFVFCSSKIINPTNPQAIVSPINGRVTEIQQIGNSITISIETKWNGRIYAPGDLQNIAITYTKGFYFPFHNKISQILGAHDNLYADIIFDGSRIEFGIDIFPRFFKICTLKCSNNEALFLDKIGFLNIGKACLYIKGDNLEVCINEGDKVIAGISPVITRQQ